MSKLNPKHIKTPIDLENGDDPQDPVSYKVGYKKPPKQNRFTKGQSGNPHGRPKGTRNFATILNTVLQQLVVIHENGRSRTVTKFEAATIQLANKAAGGDIHSYRLITQLIPGVEAELSKAGAPIFSSEQDQMVVAQILKRAQMPSTLVVGAESLMSDSPEPIGDDKKGVAK